MYCLCSFSFCFSNVGVIVEVTAVGKDRIKPARTQNSSLKLRAFRLHGSGFLSQAALRTLAESSHADGEDDGVECCCFGFCCLCGLAELI